MERLEINTIPNFLLARILLQLHSLPPKEIPDFINILAAGLQRYGSTGNINAFLDYCSTLAQDTPWLWEYYEINNEGDWDLASLKKPQELVGLRFLLASETARRSVHLTRFGRNEVLDPKCFRYCQGRILPVDQILYDTLDYLKQEQSDTNKLVEQFIELRLEQYTRDKFKFQQESKDLDNTNYQLMGALMARYDSSASNGSAPDCWCLYFRDYVDSDGSAWRVIYTDKEHTITSEQALADIRGMDYESVQPSEFSKEYRPVYLFYVNQELITATSEKEEHITLDDYTFDEDYEYTEGKLAEEEKEEEDETCTHCGLGDAVGNDIFFCESCNRGVHQLCEVPQIQLFEKDVDPWYCRTCCDRMGIPLPQPPPLTAETLLSILQASLGSIKVPVKRKWEDENIDKINEI